MKLTQLVAEIKQAIKKRQDYAPLMAELMHVLGMSMGEFAEAIGVSGATVSNWMSERDRYPKPGKIALLERYIQNLEPPSTPREPTPRLTVELLTSSGSCLLASFEVPLRIENSD